MNIPDLLLKYLNITAAMLEKVFRKMNVSSIIIVIPDPLTNCKLQNLSVLTAMRDKLFVKKCFSYHHCSDRRYISDPLKKCMLPNLNMTTAMRNKAQDLPVQSLRKVPASSLEMSSLQ